jgi:hypothetical protein
MLRKDAIVVRIVPRVANGQSNSSRTQHVVNAPPVTIFVRRWWV